MNENEKNQRSVDAEVSITEPVVSEIVEPKVEMPKVEEPKVEMPKAEEPKVEMPKAEETKKEETKKEEEKVEETKKEETKKEEPKTEEEKERQKKLEEKMAAREENLKNLNITFEAKRLGKARDAIENTIHYYKVKLFGATGDQKADIKKELTKLEGNEKKILAAMTAMKIRKDVDMKSLKDTIREADRAFYQTTLPQYGEDYDIDKEVLEEMKNRTRDMDFRRPVNSNSFRGSSENTRSNESSHNGGRPDLISQEQVEDRDFRRPVNSNSFRGSSGNTRSNEFSHNGVRPDLISQEQVEDMNLRRPVNSNSFRGSSGNTRSNEFSHNGGRPDLISQEQVEGQEQESFEEVPQEKNIKLSDILNTNSTAKRRNLLLGLSDKEKLNLLNNVANDRIENTQERPQLMRFVPLSVSYIALPKEVVEVNAEENKLIMKEYVQEHLIAAKAQSDLVLKGLAKDLEGVNIEEDKEMYGVKKLKFKRQSIVDGDKLDESVDFKTAFKRGAKYYAKEAWRGATASSRMTGTMYVPKAKKEFKDIPKDQLEESQKDIEIYKYDYNNSKYDKEAAIHAVDQDPYKDIYAKYAEKQAEIKKQDPEKDLEGKELEFVNMYKKYRGNLECAKEMQGIYSIYEDRHPIKTTTQIYREKLDTSRHKHELAAGIRNAEVRNPKSYGEKLRLDLQAKVKTLDQQEQERKEQYSQTKQHNDQTQEER